ncbi:MAG: glycogen-binding domain-containing protein [Verrucomicrobiae bacterium]|nr:glycogen-binding domain-containing protein [Verrucomicrobiae bacterium]
MAKKTKQKTTAVKNNPAAVPAAKASSTCFRLSIATAKQVGLAGDFNGWKPQPMKKSDPKRGSWEIVVSLKPGVYQYKFVVDGEWRHDPACAENVHNSMGTLNSVVRVK